MLDDISYLAADATVGLEFNGYNVYCDGVKLNAEPVAANSYTHNDVENGSHTYHVTAFYNRGESEASEPLVLSVSGIDNIMSENAAIVVEGRTIIVTAASGAVVHIVSVDGKNIATATGDTRVSVVPGVYLVKVDNTVTKVIVR